MKWRPIIFSTEMVKAILDGRKTMTRRVVTPNTSIVGEGRVDWSKFDWEQKTEHDFGCTRYSTKSEYVPDELKGQLIGIKKAPAPLIDGQANEYYPYEHQYLHVPWNWAEDATIFRIYPKWDIGDRLWVRESWFADKQYDHLKPIQIPITSLIGYTARDVKPKDWGGKTRSGRFMPRWASRITLEIIDIRVERVQEISEEDARREGANHSLAGILPSTYRECFSGLWDSLNAKRGYSWETNPWVWVRSFKIVDHN